MCYYVARNMGTIAWLLPQGTGCETRRDPAITATCSYAASSVTTAAPPSAPSAVSRDVDRRPPEHIPWGVSTGGATQRRPYDPPAPVLGADATWVSRPALGGV